MKDMELAVKQVQQNLKDVQDKQKSYAYLKRTPREFQVGEQVYIKVKPQKRSLRPGRYSKSGSRYFGPFGILAKVGPVTYQLALLPMIKVHNVFHVSILKKYVHDATHVIDWNFI